MFDRYNTPFVSKMDVVFSLNNTLRMMQLWSEYDRNIGITVLDAVAAGHGITIYDAPKTPCSVVVENDECSCH